MFGRTFRITLLLIATQLASGCCCCERPFFWRKYRGGCCCEPCPTCCASHHLLRLAGDTLRGGPPARHAGLSERLGGAAVGAGRPDHQPAARPHAADQLDRAQRRSVMPSFARRSHWSSAESAAQIERARAPPDRRGRRADIVPSRPPASPPLTARNRRPAFQSAATPQQFAHRGPRRALPPDVAAPTLDLKPPANPRRARMAPVSHVQTSVRRDLPAEHPQSLPIPARLTPSAGQSPQESVPRPGHSRSHRPRLSPT